MNKSTSALEDAFDDLLAQQITDTVTEVASVTDPEAYKDEQLPVDVVQFVEDREYLGGQVKLQDAVLQTLWDIEDPDVRDVDLELGKGSGKSEICSLCQLYGVYKVERLKNPHRLFGLSPSTLIAAVNVSIGREQAKDVVFQSIKGKIEASPYFQKLNPNVLTREIELPGNIRIYCGHSGDKAWLGYATIRGVMDEVNYMFDNQHRNVAQQLYDALRGSMKTRFKNNYKLVSVSSVTLPTTWLHSRIEQARLEGQPYIPVVHGFEMISQNENLVEFLSPSDDEEQITRTAAIKFQVRVEVTQILECDEGFLVQALIT